jgi:hypothetical protein
MQGEGFFFLGILGFFFILWAYSGGPTRPISYAGAYITPITNVGQTQVGYGPKFTLGGSLTLPGVAVTGGTHSPNTSVQNNSPYASVITLSHATGAVFGTAAKEGFIQISVASSAGKDIDVTGWKLSSSATGASATIPTGALVMHLNAKNTQQEILLHPGDQAGIADGASPVGTSFEENKCLGYVNQNQSLYNPCVAGHVNEAGFLTGNWYAYLGRSAPLWGASHDTVTLSDTSGKTVASVSY